eukprot:CAMPEP_0174361936 /NCGR_PEP_ID=MMETSP0811_2-20130205/61744_1 /TAXON_ID=73025 ORGANISM="Eutreptiella gymnastica-like, Strain CCMP1594" /NCGR_SAMPLE_ID=MMETSP0811_2 /ASSEMBLY_ACC=CAM_ASM_000667 /LENGTH=107 /DNA_ID=CAMNT_0015499063 /DNA_START=948 /DNA_END=1272 /DNA_ORIENTATION=+
MPFDIGGPEQVVSYALNEDITKFSPSLQQMPSQALTIVFVVHTAPATAVSTTSEEARPCGDFLCPSLSVLDVLRCAGPQAWHLWSPETLYQTAAASATPRNSRMTPL